MPAIEVYIGLGSNLANPLRQLAQAVAKLASLPDTSLVAQSPFYRSRPIGPQDQPDFINGAVKLHTSLEPLILLGHLQRIENAHGRRRNQHWGPRTLDLDLLLYGDHPVQNERLIVPHPELTNRDFVLQPLLDLSPGLILPDGRALQVLRHQCPDNGLKRLEPEHRDSPP
ncbi:MAG: 2-amino-4-hydroxy-6-hydroxymethyldihydropteridine diphosphokinase [Marinobacter sp.]|uniref:2-amino-4-hydroxy-6- hydroxymethyldihydropteridine diphosphokinase n=1 Tax=Marinobacter sp. TaxID=50741 RepID=UPI0034A02250